MKSIQEVNSVIGFSSGPYQRFGERQARVMVPKKLKAAFACPFHYS